MIINSKQINPILKQQLKDYVHPFVGIIHQVYKELPNGMPEYIYQEALELAFQQAEIPVEKEYRHHPVFRGTKLSSFLKMDLMIPGARGNVIIECKAIEEFTAKEYQQIFSYLFGTKFPIGILVNFHSYPQVDIQKFYYDKSDNTISPF
ncbi:MAG: GxxExxY protein [bacterium]|nr:GxxExxY protein [bacterium]